MNCGQIQEHTGKSIQLSVSESGIKAQSMLNRQTCRSFPKKSSAYFLSGAAI